MENIKVMFSRQSDEYETPQDLFDELNKEFNFTLDVSATKENAKCDNYYTMEDDGLSKSWSGTCWMNPPYSQSKQWIKKAYLESLGGTTVVALLPARTDTIAFHTYIYNMAEIRFLKGRLKFSNSKNSAPFPSMVVIFRAKNIKEN